MRGHCIHMTGTEDYGKMSEQKKNNQFWMDIALGVLLVLWVVLLALLILIYVMRFLMYIMIY